MGNEALRGRLVGDIVGQDRFYAYALYYLGIKFYEYSEHTLEQVCQERGLSLGQVTKELESVVEKNQTTYLPLVSSCPIDVIIEYLKHTHLIFIKYKLPYIACLIESFQTDCESEKIVEEDLKILFPLFLEDFVHHIHKEEDTLFYYIQILHKATLDVVNPSQLYYMVERNSLQQYAIEHEMHDDEIEGLRKITNNYTLHRGMPLHMKVIYTELAELEKSLETHAHIENEILFPKAILLEKRIRQMIKDKIVLN